MGGPDGVTDPVSPVALAPAELRRTLAVLEPGSELGPYRVVERIGGGGMGEVYRAHDPGLGRDLALKVLRPGVADGATAGDGSLAREARALAKLAHPNVVVIHGVGERDGCGYVAMELVVGGSLRAWLARPRPWRETLAMCLAAGDGLAAAHGAGLVHRDIKPENILVGDDGRARVGDFGLAGAVGEAGGEPIAGTPAYMAPEQMRGERVDARADQFAFAIVVWEALAGARPFAGSGDVRLAAIAAGPTPPRRGPVPTAVWRALVQAVAADPAQRHADLATLLAALRVAARPRIGRRLWIVLAGGAVAAAGAAALMLRPAAAGDPCARAGDAEAAALSDALLEPIAAVAGADAERQALLAVIRTRVTAARANLRDAARTVCRAGATRAWPPELVARAGRCLQVRREVARTLLSDVALARVDLGAYAVKVSSVPVGGECADAAALAVQPSLGTRSERAIPASVALISASVELAIGRTAEAEAAIAAAAAIIVAGDDPVLDARVLLARGQLAAEHDRPADAERLLTDAYYGARAAGDDAVALTALGALITSASLERFDAAAAATWIRTGLAEAEAERRRSPPAAARLLMAVAGAEQNRGDLPAAIAHARAALALLASGPESLQLADGEMFLAGALANAGELDEALAHYPRAIAITARELGAHHPRAVRMTLELALTQSDAGHDDEADALIDGVRGLLAASTSTSVEHARALVNFAAVESRGSDPRDAEAFLRRARAIFVAVHGTAHPDVALIDSNLAIFHIDRGELDQAIALLRGALATQEQVFGAEHPEVAGTLFNLTAALRKRGDRDEAVRHIARAAAIYEHAAPSTPYLISVYAIEAQLLLELGRAADALPVAERCLARALTSDDPQDRAMGELAVGAALVELRRDPRRARALLVSARAYFAGWPDELGSYVVQIDELLPRL